MVDYRRLNKHTTEETFPLPDIDAQLMRLAGIQFFVLLDHGFLQIPLAADSKPKTAFVTEDAAYMFERVMFGLKNVPQIFAKLMNVALGQHRDKPFVPR